MTANCNSKIDAFNPNDSDYHGPPLPLRYEGIILPRRFYSCYKDEEEQVQKPRRHRVSHGKISFAELSKMISSQWKDAGKVDSHSQLELVIGTEAVDAGCSICQCLVNIYNNIIFIHHRL